MGLSSLLIILSHFCLDIVLIKSLESKDGLETIERTSPFITSRKNTISLLENALGIKLEFKMEELKD